MTCFSESFLQKVSTFNTLNNKKDIKGRVPFCKKDSEKQVHTLKIYNNYIIL